MELAAQGWEQSAANMYEVRQTLCAEIERLHGASVLEPGDRLAPSILAVLLPGPPAEVWMHHLASVGVMTSVGSACQAKAREISPALMALGLDEEQARGVLRLSFSRYSTTDQAREAGARLQDVASLLTERAR